MLPTALVLGLVTAKLLSITPAKLEIDDSKVNKFTIQLKEKPAKPVQVYLEARGVEFSSCRLDIDDDEPHEIVVNGVPVFEEKSPSKIPIKLKVYEEIASDYEDFKETEQSYEITRTPTPGGTCTSLGDPHYKTFDGHKFDFMLAGTYTFFKTRDFEIQTTQTPCFGKSKGPTCNQAVAIRYGSSVFALDVRHSNSLRQITGKNKGIKYTPPKANGVNHAITFPCGSKITMIVNKQKNYKWFDLTLTAAGGYEKSVGMCNKLGNKDGKLHPKSGSPLPLSKAVDFCKSWKVPESENMLLGNYELTTPAREKPVSKCVFPKGPREKPTPKASVTLPPFVPVVTTTVRTTTTESDTTPTPAKNKTPTPSKTTSEPSTKTPTEPENVYGDIDVPKVEVSESTPAPKPTESDSDDHTTSAHVSKSTPAASGSEVPSGAYGEYEFSAASVPTSPPEERLVASSTKDSTSHSKSKPAKTEAVPAPTEVAPSPSHSAEVVTEVSSEDGPEPTFAPASPEFTKQAENHCNNLFPMDCAPLVDRDFYVQACKKDAILIGSLAYAEPMKMQYMAQCKTKTDFLREDISEKVVEKANEIQKAVGLGEGNKCPKECSGNGVCGDNGCRCNPGFGGADCAIDLTKMISYDEEKKEFKPTTPAAEYPSVGALPVTEKDDAVAVPAPAAPATPEEKTQIMSSAFKSGIISAFAIIFASLL